MNLFALFDRHQMQAAVHCIGDRAMDMVIEADCEITMSERTMLKGQPRNRPLSDHKSTDSEGDDKSMTFWPTFSRYLWTWI